MLLYACIALITDSSQSAQVLYQNLTMLNSTGTVPLGNPSSVHPLHAHVARYRYAAREALCCLRGNGSMARTAGSTVTYASVYSPFDPSPVCVCVQIAPCDDPLLSLLPRYSVSRSLCLRGGDSAFDMLMCVAAELLRVDGERFVPPNATVHPSLWASNNNDSLRVDVRCRMVDGLIVYTYIIVLTPLRSPASVLHFVRAVESTLLLTLGVHGHPEGMPNVTSLLIVTNTTSFVVPLAFSTGTFTINQNGRDYVGSVSAATTRKILHPHQFIHAPPASDYETFPVAHSDVNLTRRRQNISLFKKSRKVKSTPPQVTTYIGQMCENAQGNAVYPVAPIPYPPVIHPHWLQLGTTAYGTPVVGSLRFTNTHGMPLSIFGVSLRCELPLHTKILFHGVNTRTFPYSGWPSFVPKNTYGTSNLLVWMRVMSLSKCFPRRQC